MQPADASPLAAIVLAAGASSRMGRCKAMLPWRGRTLLEHAVALASSAAASPIAVVDGAHELSAGSPATRIHNPAWRDGPLSSLQAGLRGLGFEREPVPVLVLTVDRPHVAIETITALVEAHERDPVRVWQPRHRGRHGHPILYPAALVPALLALEPTSSPRDLLARSEVAALRGFIDVDDPAVLENIDTPQAYAALLRRG